MESDSVGWFGFHEDVDDSLRDLFIDSFFVKRFILMIIQIYEEKFYRHLKRKENDYKGERTAREFEMKKVVLVQSYDVMGARKIKWSQCWFDDYVTATRVQ